MNTMAIRILALYSLLILAVALLCHLVERPAKSKRSYWIFDTISREYFEVKK